MQELDSEQMQIIIAGLIVLVVIAFMAGYAVRAAISQSRRRHYSSVSVRRKKQWPASSFNTQSAGISASPPVAPSSAPGMLTETVVPQTRAVETEAQ